MRTNQRWLWGTWSVGGVIHPVLTEMRNQSGTLTIAIAIAATVPLFGDNVAEVRSDLNVDLALVVDDAGATHAGLQRPDVSHPWWPTKIPAGDRSLSNRDVNVDAVSLFSPIARVVSGPKTHER